MTALTEPTKRSRKDQILSVIIPAIRGLLLPVGAILLALLIGAVFILIIGKNPIGAYAALLQGAFGDLFSIGETLEAATPLIFTGLAVAYAFRAKMFNIGAEGQFLMGALAATWVGIFLPLPGFLHVIAVVLAGFISGGLWGGIAGGLKALRGVNEVISTIMLNFIAILFISWIVTGPMKEISDLDIPQTAQVLESARLLKILPPSRLSAGIILALVTAAVVSWILWKTTVGYELRGVGLNPFASEQGGIKPNRTMFTSMLVSGGLAGMGGAVIISGLFLRYQQGFEPGYGFTAIAVALVGGSTPSGVVLAAFLFAILGQGARGMQNVAGVPQDTVLIIQALVIFFVAAPQIVRALPDWIIKRREKAQAAAEGTQLEGGQA